MDYAVELRHMTKSFGENIANQDVSVAIPWGSIHGLIGENGAGKTTLMKMLYGMYPPDSGEIYIDGNRERITSPKEAISLGIGMVHQHFTLVDSLTVAQNIILGKPICRKNGLIDFAKTRDRVYQLGIQYGLSVDPDARIKDLPVAMRQRVEILKSLYLGARILILDEPTAVLTPQEIIHLLKTLVLLKEQGKCMILITHKLKELMDVTDRITVLRNGRVTGDVKTAEVNEQTIASMMVGKNIKFHIDKKPFTPKNTVLCARDLLYYNQFGVKMLDHVSFHIRAGEILGIAGVQGNGQTELIEVLSGLIPNYSGDLLLNGQCITNRAGVSFRRKAGLGHIPEDRQTMGAALGVGLVENFIMGGTENRAYTAGCQIRYNKAAQAAEAQFKEFDVKYADIRIHAGSLSGGNLQKVIVARELSQKPELLIAAQPSRGVDIGATLFIHKKLTELRDSGKAVLLVSSELSEIMSLSDRILVMYKGAIVGETTPEESTEEDVGLLMAGIHKKEVL